MVNDVLKFLASMEKSRSGTGHMLCKMLWINNRKPCFMQGFRCLLYIYTRWCITALSFGTFML